MIAGGEGNFGRNDGRTCLLKLTIKFKTMLLRLIVECDPNLLIECVQMLFPSPHGAGRNTKLTDIRKISMIYAQ